MIFDIPADDFSDIMTLDQFVGTAQCGAFIPSDGCGWIGTETHHSYDLDVWDWYFRNKDLPIEATHVHWYNK